ncbi:MAG: hypothetical protein JST27_00380 [Bacteroidetes bacterium]|nr:hypothetical protein [Bacteroidota bacterium]
MHDDTTAVHAARDSVAFANNGTLYFPVGRYMGKFKFEFEGLLDYNEINITGDGHGSVLCCNGTQDGPLQPFYEAVVVLGYRMVTWKYARVSNLTIDGQFQNVLRACPGIEFGNPDNGQNTEAGRWIFERVYITNCYIGVFKPFGNIGNHFIDCTWDSNTIGVKAIGVANQMHAGCDRYSGGHFSGCEIAGLLYEGGDASAPQVIIDGTIFENNPDAWAISISSTGKGRMFKNAVCLRNVWFECNGHDDIGGDLYFEGVRSVRIDDSGIDGRIHILGSSVNLYNCLVTRNAGNTPDYLYVDEKSSLVAYEHRYYSYPTSKVYVHSISYDGSQDIQPENWQPTSVWGPLRCCTVLVLNQIVSQQFDFFIEPFGYLPGPGTQNTTINTMRVLGKASGMLTLSAGDHIKSRNIIGVVNPSPNPKYLVWSIHTYLLSEVPAGHDVDEIYGEITTGSVSLGRIYFKYNQWVCSYGMKLVDVTNGLNIELHFYSGTLPWIPGYDATILITDYQIVAFEELHSANSYVNSRAFADGLV